MALACMAATVGIVYADRGGCHHNADGTVSFLDSVYYAAAALEVRRARSHRHRRIRHEGPRGGPDPGRPWRPGRADRGRRPDPDVEAQPSAGRVMEDLITYGSGLDLVERPVTKAEAGRSPRELRDLVVAVKRGHRLLDHDDPEAAVLEPADRIIAIQRAVA
jgi:hypothetical protein